MARKKTRAVLILLIVFVTVLASLCVWLVLERRLPRAETPAGVTGHGNGLFSWHDEVFDTDERETLFRLMREQDLTELYQDVPRDMPAPQIREFAQACKEHGVAVYLLIGEPEWALDEDGSKLLAQIQRAALMGFTGVTVDIEPVTTDEWKKDRESVMKTMTAVLLRGKAAAEENGLQTIVCLPYYFDDYGLEEKLETIVERGCDALAIMDYNRKDEIGQIENEAALCKKHGKRLIHVYELQEVGKHGLTAFNTYRDAGLSALQNSRKALTAAFADQKLTVALHEYRALKEMAEE